MQQALCEHEGSAGVWAWASLVLPQCIMVHLICQHVERLTILLNENHCQLARCSLQPSGCARGECRSSAPRSVTLLVCTCQCQSTELRATVLCFPAPPIPETSPSRSALPLRSLVVGSALSWVHVVLCQLEGCHVLFE